MNIYKFMIIHAELSSLEWLYIKIYIYASVFAYLFNEFFIKISVMNYHSNEIYKYNPLCIYSTLYFFWKNF